MSRSTRSRAWGTSPARALIAQGGAVLGLFAFRGISDQPDETLAAGVEARHFLHGESDRLLRLLERGVLRRKEVRQPDLYHTL